MPQKTTPPVVVPQGCVTAAAWIFITLIGLGQLGGGIGGLVIAVRGLYVEPDWESAVLGTLCATVFGSVGVGLLMGALLQRRRDHAVGQIHVDPPADEPWQMRPDWAAGRVVASGGATLAAPLLAAVALWWNLASLPLLAALPRFLQQATTMWAWIVVLFPIVGAALIAAFFYQYFRAHKFGDSVFELAGVPGVIGGQLAGVVRIPGRIRAQAGFRLRLVCVEWVLQGAGDRRRNRVDHVIWQDERVVMEPLLDGNETSVPVLFAIPFNSPESPRADAKRDFEWRLEVRAHLPGIDYDATFHVPVYKTAASRKDFQLDEKLLSEYASPAGNELILRDAGIVRENVAGDGVRLTVRAARNWRSALAFLLLGLAFSGIAFTMILYNQEAQEFFNLKKLWANVARDFNILKTVMALFRTLMALFAGSIFLLITLMMILVGLDLLLYRSVVEASSAGLTVRGGWLGIGRKRFYPDGDVRRFKLEEYMRSSGGGLWQSVVLVPRRGKGRQRAIAKGIASKLAQEAVIDELTKAMGR